MIKKRILVVDDDSNNCCAFMAHMQDESTDVCCLASVAEVLDSIMKVNYCLIILNNQISGISGIEMVRIMRLTQHIPIIVITAPLVPDDKTALLRAGADAIIDKPFDMDLCAAQAESLIQLYANSDIKRSDVQEEQIVFGAELIIFPRFRQVFVNGKSVSLTRKEFDLLLHFARNPQRVYSREQLYVCIWGDSFAAGGDETVKVHIRTLRKKIETHGKTLIYNVWGVGYKFVPPNGQANSQK